MTFSVFYRNILKPFFSINTIYIIISLLFIVGLPMSIQAAKVTDFIPTESVLYIELKDIDEIYSEIQISEQWKQAFDLMLDESDLQKMKQALMFGQAITDIKPADVIDTIGYHTGFALWLSEQNLQQGGFVIHSGGNLADLQRYTKIVMGFLGMNEGKLKLDAGEYRNVKYDTLELPDVLITYGFVGDFLVVGINENSFEDIGENSFETLIDTYRKKSPSIRKNESYSKISKKYEDGQLTAYINIPNFIQEIRGLSSIERTQLETFNNVYASLNLLEVAPLLQVYTELNPDHEESMISPFLKEGSELKTLDKVIGDEDLFVAIAPELLDSIWQYLQTEIETNGNEEVYAFIIFLEGLLNLNMEEDIMAGLTGELALSVDNLSKFEPDALESLDIQLEDTFSVDATNVQTGGGLIFIPKYPDKWKQIGNSLSNLQNTSLSQFDYKGADVLEFSSNIYYGQRDDISFLSFSEDQLYTIVDRLQEKRKLSYLKQLPKKPLAVFKLDLLTLIESMDDKIQIENHIIRPDDINPLLAWITVKDNEVELTLSLSEKESPLDLAGKFAPIIATNIKN